MNLEPLKTKLAQLHYRFWFIDVLYPFLLCLILFVALTYFIYSGQKHRRLSSNIEESLIAYSLRQASPRIISKSSNIVTITLKNRDLLKEPHLNYFKMTDATWEVYEEIFEILRKHEVKEVVVHWLPQLHKSMDELQKIVDYFSMNKLNIKFSVETESLKYMPQYLIANGMVLESDPCQSGVQNLCTYDPVWSNWVIQYLADHFIDKKLLEDKPNFVSNNLPRIYPSYLLYLNEHEDFTDYSFSEVLTSHNLNLRGKTIFLGRSLIQGRPNINFPDSVGRVLVANNEPSDKTRIDGVPFHKFWAQLSQMFQDQAFVRVVPYGICISLMILFILFITLSMIFWGPVISIVGFSCIAFIGPFINSLAIQFANVYLPIFDFIYGGLLTFITLTFFMLSYESFKSWKVSFEKQSAADLSDAKSNFISLISHNLNTPIAKAQALIEILWQKSADNKSSLQDIQTLVTYIQICTKIVLVTTSVEDHKVNPAPLNLLALIEEIKTTTFVLLKKIGFDVEFSVREDEMNLIPLKFDIRILSTLLLAMGSSYYVEDHRRKLKFMFNVEESKDDRYQLKCEISSNTQATNPKPSLLFEISQKLIDLTVLEFDAVWQRESGLVILPQHAE